MTDGQLILVAGLLMAAGLAAAKVADRVRVPGLLLFLGLGMLVGSEGIGGVEFDDAELTRTLGTIGLVLILFEGGLTAGWPEIRPVLGSAVSLASLGTIATAVIAGVFATWVFDVDLLGGLIIGSAIAASDSAAIFAVLRGSSLRRRLARTLEGESGMNDPIAVLLVVGFIDWIQMPDYGVVDMAHRARGQALDRPRGGDRDRNRRPRPRSAASTCLRPASTPSPRSRRRRLRSASPRSRTARASCPSTSPRSPSAPVRFRPAAPPSPSTRA